MPEKKTASLRGAAKQFDNPHFNYGCVLVKLKEDFRESIFHKDCGLVVFSNKFFIRASECGRIDIYDYHRGQSAWSKNQPYDVGCIF